MEPEPWRGTGSFNPQFNHLNVSLVERVQCACVHNGRLVVFTGRGGRGGEHRWAYERATDGSWSSSESEYGWGDYRYTFVSESVLLG